jgi:hypothetical protein
MYVQIFIHYLFVKLNKKFEERERERSKIIVLYDKIAAEHSLLVV